MPTMQMSVILVAILTSVSAFAGTPVPVKKETSDIALGLLIQNAPALKLTGDVKPNETLGSLLVRYIAPAEPDAKVTNECEATVNATVLVCHLTYSTAQSDEDIAYQFNMTYDSATEKTTVQGLASPNLVVSRGASIRL